MAITINYQLSIFGTYSVEPTPENITLLMTKINQETDKIFLPNLITGQKIEIPTNKITTTSNLGYITQNQKYKLSILNDRIDISYDRIDDIEPCINEFFDFAVKVLRVVMETCNLQARRLAANIEILADELCEDQIYQIGKNIISGVNYYKNRPFMEWSARINSESIVQINGTEENLNTILNITTAKIDPAQKISVIYHLDINTLPQLTELRFNATSLSEFTNEVLPIVKTVLSDVEELISID